MKNIDSNTKSSIANIFKKVFSSYKRESKIHLKITAFLLATLAIAIIIVFLQQNQIKKNKITGIQCSDNIDNDGDGAYDFDGIRKRTCLGILNCKTVTYSKDPDCLDLNDNFENPVVPGERYLVFSDDFNGDRLDNTKWGVTSRFGSRTRPSKDLQWFVDDAHTVSNGTLKINAEHKTINKDNPSWTADYDPIKYPFTSGMINSFVSADSPYLVDNHFPYGYFEARIKVPSKPGSWPGFWLLPAPVVANNYTSYPGIVAMEMYTTKTNTIGLGLHNNCNYPLLGGGRCGEVGTEYTLPSGYQGDFSTKFHTFAVDWQPELLIWYIDDVEIFRTTDSVPTIIPNNLNGMAGMYMMVTLEIGTDYQKPNPADFPQQLEIDYIKYYQYQF